jgi:aminoglycoside phosphotransferase (APT) family kinase protein
MTPGEQAHGEFIRACLARMGRSRDDLRQYERLQGGVSGSGTYRLVLASEAVILKVTAADREPFIVERARREAEFYRRLADRVPVRVPRPLAVAIDDDFGICLMLSRHPACPPAPAWREAEFLRAGEELGRLHAAFWDRIERLAEYRWLRRRQPAELPVEVAQARRYWQELWEIDRFRVVLTPQCRQRIDRLLERIEAIEQAVESLPPTLCHGDFHSGNLLDDGRGGFIWADWQEVGLGPGPEDLSFFIQRASFAGASVPVEGMIRAYQQSLEAASGRVIPAASLQRVMEGAELRTRLLHWPAYLKQASEDSLAGIMDRIDQLAGSLQVTC